MRKTLAAHTYRFILASAVLVLLLGCLGWYWFAIELPNKPPEPAATGNFPAQPVWVFKAPRQIISSPSVHGSSIFVRTATTLYALDAASGKILWQAASPAYLWQSSVPSTYTKALAVPEKDAWVSIFAMDSGELLWQRGPSKGASSPQIESIAFGSDTVYVTRLNWRLTAYDLKSGRTIWEKDVPTRTTLNIVADQSAVYLGAEQQLEAFDPTYGTLLWRKDYDNDVRSLLLNKDILYMTIPYGERNLVALDVNTHNEIWGASSTELQAAELSSLAMTDNILYASGRRLFALSSVDGAILWESNLAGLLEQPIVLNNKVYVRNETTTLYVLDAKTGQVTGHLLVQSDYPLVGPETGRGPVVAGDLLIVPFGDNRLFAYQP